MIRPNLINIRSSERPKQPLAEKKMLWPPSFQGDECLRFPSVNSIRQRYDSDHHDFLIDEFFLAISQSVERIFIIDRYFLRPHEGETVKDRLDYFLYSMESGSFHAKEVKIISSGKSELQSSQDRFQSFADKFNQRPSTTSLIN